MARRKASKRGWLKLLFVVILVYSATFLVWSRVRTFKPSLQQERFWSFFPPPNGLAAVNPARWSQWKRNERVAATIFWPCVLLDEKLTKRRYWPARFADPPQVSVARLSAGEASPMPSRDG
jgi:hypothetical protein